MSDWRSRPHLLLNAGQILEMDVYLQNRHFRESSPIGERVGSAELRRDGRLARIAKALVSGGTVTDIAEAEGIGPDACIARSELARVPVTPR